MQNLDTNQADGGDNAKAAQQMRLGAGVVVTLLVGAVFLLGLKSAFGSASRIPTIAWIIFSIIMASAVFRLSMLYQNRHGSIDDASERLARWIFLLLLIFFLFCGTIFGLVGEYILFIPIFVFLSFAVLFSKYLTVRKGYFDFRASIAERLLWAPLLLAATFLILRYGSLGMDRPDLRLSLTITGAALITALIFLFAILLRLRRQSVQTPH